MGLLARPAAALLFFTAIVVAWHVPAAYDAAERTEALHALEHASLLWAGLILWMPILGPRLLRGGTSGFGRIGLALAAMVPMSLLGIWLMTATHPVYSAYSGEHGALADQRLAAIIMLGAGNALMAAVAITATWANLQREERRQRLREARGAPVQAGLAVLLLAAAAGLFANSAVAPATPSYDGQVHPGQDPDPKLAAAGRQLYLEGCSRCHGDQAQGLSGTAPNLHGAGAAAADFYLRTGRMPLADPRDQPERADSPYTDAEISELVNYLATLGGPPIPSVDAGAGSLSDGQRLFTENCAGCHQVVAQGGIVTKGLAPDLSESSSTDVAEAVKVGPYVMPAFPQLDSGDVNSLARYVAYAKNPDDRGGWGIGHIGPIPEGMVAWLLAGAALLLVIRLIGERAR
jgi:ubiquinol-cytochrome c reductase cytochrome c subunit